MPRCWGSGHLTVFHRSRICLLCHGRDSLTSSAGTLEEAHGVDVRRGAAKLPHAVSLARFGRLRSVTFRHEHYVSSIPTCERFAAQIVVWVQARVTQHTGAACCTHARCVSQYYAATWAVSGHPVFPNMRLCSPHPVRAWRNFARMRTDAIGVCVGGVTDRARILSHKRLDVLLLLLTFREQPQVPAVLMHHGVCRRRWPQRRRRSFRCCADRILQFILLLIAAPQATSRLPACAS